MQSHLNDLKLISNVIEMYHDGDLTAIDALNRISNTKHVKRMACWHSLTDFGKKPENKFFFDKKVVDYVQFLKGGTPKGDRFIWSLL